MKVKRKMNTVKEKRDLYDVNRKLINATIFKGEPIPKGSYIVVVLVFIQNSEGKFLIQKRSEIKNGKYATTGGHPKSGESSIEGIITETKEEIGVLLDKDNLELFFSGRSDENSVFWDDYYTKMDIPDINKLKLQKSEVESICWLSIEEIKKLKNEDKFFENHYEEFEVLLDWLENNFILKFEKSNRARTNKKNSKFFLFVLVSYCIFMSYLVK